jgi:uncharacterized protein YndB with AHSA1/START domain
VRVERTTIVEAPPEHVWARLADWRTHTDWQPTLEGVDAPELIAEGARLVEIRNSHGQRLTFDVVITEFEPFRRIRSTGRSRGRVRVSADIVYEMTPQDSGTAVTMGVDAEIPFVLRPLQHAVITETENEITDSLARLASMR